MNKFYCDLEGNLFWTCQSYSNTLIRLVIQEVAVIISPTEIYNSAVSVKQFNQKFAENPVQVITSIKEICPWNINNLENKLNPQYLSLMPKIKEKYA